MAIRFTCPSCQQPIEIDDGWAGQSVGCPYCRRVVTAPTASTWPPGDVPVASPAGPAFPPPPPPPGYAQAVRPTAPTMAMPSGSAGWALALAVTCGLLSLVGWMAWMVSMTVVLEQRVGPKPNRQEVAQAYQEIITSGQAPRPRLSVAAALLGVPCGLGGLALAVRSLIRQETRRGMAVAACIISVSFTCCLGLLAMVNLAARATGT